MKSRIKRLLSCAFALLLTPLPMQAQTTAYGTSGPWTLYRSVEGGRVASCHATMPGRDGTALIFDHNSDQTSIGFEGPRGGASGTAVEVEVWFDHDRTGSQVIAMPHEGTWRFGHDIGGQWQIAVRHEFAGETPYGSISFDGHMSGITGWGDGSWVVLWPNLGEYEALASGNVMEVHLGPVRYRLSLYGTAAAALKVRECVENRGLPPGARASAIGDDDTASEMPDPRQPGEIRVGNCETPYASYRCTATSLTPTGRFGEAMLIADPLGSEPTFILQTDRTDLSEVWVSFDGASFVHIGLWGSDGECLEPLADQTPEVVAALGHDAWRLCIR
jgi:hypothetical protein